MTSEHPDHNEILVYLEMLSTQHRYVYIECNKDTKKEQTLSSQLKARWRELHWTTKNTLGQIQKAAQTGAPHPPEYTKYVKMLADSIAHSQTVILRRTEEMIARRADGVYPKEDDTCDPDQMIYTVHDNVVRTDLGYKNMETHQFDCVNVKIPLPITNPADEFPEVEFVWVYCKGEVDGKLLGEIYQEPQWASGFSQDDEVSFDVAEIHDVHSNIAQPTDTVVVNNAEGRECLLYFCENLTIAQKNPELTWLRMSDREKLHIISFCKALHEESRRSEERRKAREARKV